DRGIPVPAAPRDSSVAIAEGGLVLAVLGLAFAFAVGGYLVGRETAGEHAPSAPTAPVETTEPGEVAGDPANGKAVFASEGCGGCHALADAGATGAVGPSLDGNAALTEQLLVDRVTNGMGAMPAFGERLSEQEIADVSAYILSAATP
ncbi:MAG: c-type cytochrome, partial [Thermoleophilia bacterium]|nr:c-type cytochrome [Thermoleophilia bacterium]